MRQSQLEPQTIRLGSGRGVGVPRSIEAAAARKRPGRKKNMITPVRSVRGTRYTVRGTMERRSMEVHNACVHCTHVQYEVLCSERVFLCQEFPEIEQLLWACAFDTAEGMRQDFRAFQPEWWAP